MAAKDKFMVDLPDSNRPGEFFEHGPVSRDAALAYLRQWFPSAPEVLLVEMFVSRLDGDEEEDVLEAAVPGPRYTHDCHRCVFEGRFGEYDAYFCSSTLPDYDDVVLRYGADGSGYKSRPRAVHERDPSGFPEAGVYTEVFGRHPRKEGGR